MLFSYQKKKNSLQTYHSIKTPYFKGQFYKGRAFSRFSCLQGSLTLESAIVVPLFLFALLSILYIGEALLLYVNIEGALHQSVKEMSQVAYSYEGGVGTSLIGTAYAKEKVIQNVGRDYLNSSPIRGGADGLNFYHSKILDNGNVDLIVTYYIHIPYSFLGLADYFVTQRVMAHGWIGYTGIDTEYENSDELIVYVTPNGTVYHKNRNCTHIQLSIQPYLKKDIEEKRNESGGKYYSCERCGSLSKDIIYITDTGDRYHSTVTCSGLKREIIAVPLSQVGKRNPCLRCGNTR